MRTGVAVLAGLWVATAVSAVSAWGCSCVAQTDAQLREMYAASEAAFVGTLVARRTVDEGSQEWGGDETDGFTFVVEEDFKQELGDRVEVRSSAYGASCGLEVDIGERIGLFIDRSGENWQSNLCRQVEPEDLRQAARDAPPPTGTGPPILVAGGTLGEPRVVAFDSDGEIVRYGMGKGSTDSLDACPGGQKLAELGSDGRGIFVALRSASTLRKGRDTRVRLMQSPFGQYPYGFACRGGDRPDIFVFATEGERPRSTLIRVRDGKQTAINRGRAVAAAFGEEHAYLYDVPGRRLVRVNLETSRTRVVLRDLRKLAPLAVSPDGERLLAFGYRGVDPSYYGMTSLHVLPLRGGQAHRIELSGALMEGTATWIDADSIGLFARDKTLAFSAELKRERTLPGLAGIVAIRGGTAYGLAKGTLRRMDLATGERSRLSRFPVDGFSAMVGVGHVKTSAGTASRRAQARTCAASLGW